MKPFIIKFILINLIREYEIYKEGYLFFNYLDI